MPRYRAACGCGCARCGATRPAWRRWRSGCGRRRGSSWSRPIRAPARSCCTTGRAGMRRGWRGTPPAAPPRPRPPPPPPCPGTPSTPARCSPRWRRGRPALPRQKPWSGCGATAPMPCRGRGRAASRRSWPSSSPRCPCCCSAFRPWSRSPPAGWPMPRSSSAWSRPMPPSPRRPSARPSAPSSPSTTAPPRPCRCCATAHPACCRPSSSSPATCCWSSPGRWCPPMPGCSTPRR